MMGGECVSDAQTGASSQRFCAWEDRGAGRQERGDAETQRQDRGRETQAHSHTHTHALSVQPQLSNSSNLLTANCRCTR